MACEVAGVVITMNLHALNGKKVSNHISQTRKNKFQFKPQSLTQSINHRDKEDFTEHTEKASLLVKAHKKRSRVP
ncbi:hypothetical protein SAMN04488023_11731 [Pedobacter rhizosphaerae]|uniref:Uncharacterized protein n=1 Tax=Pedobacter rhizosphaerae TaxID=390241 RepID=A0A1H9S930_9SPHI|nr:hypothetical protein SAMN04488023_11731 [Pedobacter rhizosphaerae]